jgi:hypothetical protein
MRDNKSASSVPEELRGLERITSEIRPSVGSELPVLIVVDNADLAEFSDRIWSQIDTSVALRGGSWDVTASQLLKYFATAIHTRVSHVNRQRRGAGRTELNMVRTGLTVHDKWMIPFPMQHVISSIGVNTVGDGDVLVYPVWDEGGDQFLLSLQEQQEITRKLRVLEALGMRFARALEQNNEGVVKVMTLTFSVSESDPNGEWIGNETFTVVDALSASIAGIRTADAWNVTTHPVFAPSARIRRDTVVRYLFDFATLRTADGA